jgi:hypothetical protein
MCESQQAYPTDFYVYSDHVSSRRARARPDPAQSAKN